ncbi:hypothetical protein QN277_022698 [Acacia crassicarpa]|uniref:Uncharacterized protein n=1 Tax=Acacia crassicarpa TaxID=499986 RepID=A0AAE1JFP8_9FABA|nr:hypothetical protein QN277_022698 [Acacia crassicarpa]
MILNRKIYIGVIFVSKVDKDNIGKLDLDYFQDVFGDIIERCPQVDLYLKKKEMGNIVALLKNPQENNAVLDIETFKSCLVEVDSQIKNLPTTAQVAAQQGQYLADCFKSNGAV